MYVIIEDGHYFKSAASEYKSLGNRRFFEYVPIEFSSE